MLGTRSRNGRTKLCRIAAAASASAVLSLTFTDGTIAHAQPADSAPAHAETQSHEPATPLSIPQDTPVGARSAQIVELINGDAVVDPAEVLTWTDPAVANALGGDGLAAPLEQLRTTGPYDFVGYSGTATAATVALQTRSGLPFELRVYVTDDGVVTGLLVRPHTSDVQSFTDLTSALDILGTDYSVFAARIDNSECVPVFEEHADRAMPMASVSKLYVLGAVADAIERGTLRWDETLTITDDVKSLPTGEMQDLPAGTTVTVRQAAEKMISISDNTATDLLIRHLGREAVEAQVSLMGHHDPQLLSPFPTTREAFLIGFGDTDRSAAWREGDHDERVAILDSLQGAPLDVDENAMTFRPVYQDSVDWFGSQHDICAAYAALHGKDTNVDDILSVNPGLTLSSHDWSYAGFKGGTMPGVLVTTWTLTDNRGQDWYFGIQQSGRGAIGLAENLYTFELAGKVMGRNGAAVLQIN